MFIRTLLRNIPRYTFCANLQNKELLEEVTAKVFQVMKSAAKCKQDKLTEKATFEELGFDSLDSVEMVVALEENFGFGIPNHYHQIDIKNEEAERIKGVNDAITVFYKYLAEKMAQDLQKKD